MSPKYLLPLFLLLLLSCTSQKKLAYLANLPEPDGNETFPLNFLQYKLKDRDLLYITAKAMSTEGKIEDFFQSMGGGSSMQSGGESGGYLFGYEINDEGMIRLPAIGLIKIEGLSIDEARDTVQSKVDKVIRNTVVDCKLLSYKFTVLGEVAAQGTFINSSSYLTVLDAVGRAGGLSDFGKRTRILVIRNDGSSTKTYRLSLQDKSILSSEAYYIYPNDVIVVEPNKQKVFSQNQSVITFIVSSVTSAVTMTLLLINYFK